MAKRKNPETVIMESIKIWLEFKGIFVRRMHVGGLIIGRKMVKNHTMAGFPDLFGFVGQGRMFAIEVKCPGEKLDPDQVKWMTDLHGQGAVTIMATSLDEVIQAFARPDGPASRVGW